MRCRMIAIQITNGLKQMTTYVIVIVILKWLISKIWPQFWNCTFGPKYDIAAIIRPTLSDRVKVIKVVIWFPCDTSLYSSIDLVVWGKQINIQLLGLQTGSQPSHYVCHTGRKPGQIISKWGGVRQIVTFPIWVDQFMTSRCGKIYRLTSETTLTLQVWSLFEATLVRVQPNQPAQQTSLC